MHISHLSNRHMIVIKPNENFLPFFEHAALKHRLMPAKSAKLYGEAILTSHSIGVMTCAQSVVIEHFLKKESEFIIQLLLSTWPFAFDDWGKMTWTPEFLSAHFDVKICPVVYRLNHAPFPPTQDSVLLVCKPGKLLKSIIYDMAEKNANFLGEIESEYLTPIIETGSCVIANKAQLTPQFSLELRLQLVHQYINDLPALPAFEDPEDLIHIDEVPVFFEYSQDTLNCELD